MKKGAGSWGQNEFRAPMLGRPENVAESLQVEQAWGWLESWSETPGLGGPESWELREPVKVASRAGPLADCGWDGRWIAIVCWAG